MTSVYRKFALVALCGTAIAMFSQGAQAASWSIVGGVIPDPLFTGYGTAPGQDNVVNNNVPGGFAGGGSIVTDTTAGTFWHSGSQLNAVWSNPTYNVSWTYVGSESGDVIRFNAAGGVSHLETNANNNCAGCFAPGGQPGASLAGTSVGLAVLLTPFSFTDTNTFASVANGANPLTVAAKANFILAYAALNGDGTFHLQAAASDFVVIAFNDDGSADDNHDDHMILARIVEGPPREQETPIPGALPLFGSVLGGGLLLRKLRNRRQAKAAA